MKAIPIFTPPNMTKKQFIADYVNFTRRIYSDESIERRLKNCENSGLYFINMGLKEFYNNPNLDEWAEK